jgi:hypothetical protein
MVRPTAAERPLPFRILKFSANFSDGFFGPYFMLIKKTNDFSALQNSLHENDNFSAKSLAFGMRTF